MGKKVLILTGALGDGHVQAASAVAETLAGLYPNADAKVVDFMALIHPRIHDFERFWFMQGVKRLPSVYTLLYQKTRTGNRLSDWMKQIRPSALLKLKQLIDNEQPDVLVSTFPPASAALSQLKAHNMTVLPTVTIITDHTDHSFWVYPHTDLYMVASLEVGAALQMRGVPVRNIAVTGIPIRPVFHRAVNRERLREKLGLSPDTFTVLVMGGGSGMIRPAVIHHLRRQLDSGVQLVFICGRNARLKQRLTSLFRGNSHAVVLGYVRNMHEWMAAADVLVTKPGGLTTSEALATRLPMILIEPKLGQEKDNADYLVQKGAAVVCRTGELPALLDQFMRNPGKLQAMRKNAWKTGRRHAAIQAVNQLMGMAGAGLASMGKMA